MKEMKDERISGEIVKHFVRNKTFKHFTAKSKKN